MSAPDPNGTIYLPEQFIDLCKYAGELTGWNAPSIALALTGWMVALTIFWARRRKRQGKRNRLLWTTSSITFGIAFILSLALGVNSYVGYFPSFASVGRWLSGATENSITDHTSSWINSESSRPKTTETKGVSFQVTIPSTSDQVPDSTAWVYLPPGYDQDSSDTRYQLAIGMHGDPGKGADWFTGGKIDTTLDNLISEKALPQLIFISPNLSAGMGANYKEPVNVPNGPQIESYVTNDVVGWADQNLRTKADAHDRIITGFSSGGYGALVIGLRHSDVFGGIVSLIPYTVPYTASIKTDGDLYGEYNPAVAIGNLAEGSIPPTFLGMAGLETAKNGNLLAAALQSKNATFTKRVFPGQPHTWATARIMMPYGLVWMANQLGWISPIDSDMSVFPSACTPAGNVSQ